MTSETRKSSSSRISYTRESTPQRKGKQNRPSEGVDTFEVGAPTKTGELARKLRDFVRLAQRSFVRGIRGGRTKLGRWDEAGDFIESRILREENDYFIQFFTGQEPDYDLINNGEGIIYLDAGPPVSLNFIWRDETGELFTSPITRDAPHYKVDAAPAPPPAFPDMPNSGATRANSYIADAGVTITGSGVSLWEDQEGVMDLFQSIDAERPTTGIGVGGRPVLIFDASLDQHIEKNVSAISDIVQPWTWTFVLKFTTVFDNNTKTIAQYKSASSQSTSLNLRNGGLNTLEMIDGTSDDMRSSFEPVIGTPYAIVVVGDGATSEMFVNGVSIHSGLFTTREFARDFNVKFGAPGAGVNHELSESRILDGDVRLDMDALNQYYLDRYGISVGLP